MFCFNTAVQRNHWIAKKFQLRVFSIPSFLGADRLSQAESAA
jgi:hypothetical protein